MSLTDIVDTLDLHNFYIWFKKQNKIFPLQEIIHGSYSNELRRNLSFGDKTEQYFVSMLTRFYYKYHPDFKVQWIKRLHNEKPYPYLLDRYGGDVYVILSNGIVIHIDVKHAMNGNFTGSITKSSIISYGNPKPNENELAFLVSKFKYEHNVMYHIYWQLDLNNPESFIISKAESIFDHGEEMAQYKKKDEYFITFNSSYGFHTWEDAKNNKESNNCYIPGMEDILKPNEDFYKLQAMELY